MNIQHLITSILLKIQKVHQFFYYWLIVDKKEKKNYLFETISDPKIRKFPNFIENNQKLLTERSAISKVGPKEWCKGFGVPNGGRCVHLVDHLKKGFAEYFRVEFSPRTFSSSETDRITKIQSRRHSHPDWVYRVS